jgi:hypothetical protein
MMESPAFKIELPSSLEIAPREVAVPAARRDIPRRNRFRYDAVYVRRQSFGLDLKLIAASFWMMFRGKWENREDKLRRRKL